MEFQKQACEKPSPISLKPHHFLCSLGFEGKGYSPEFVQNFWNIVHRLRSVDAGSSEDFEIEIQAGADSICQPCPNRRGNSCEKQEMIEKLDSAHSQVLGLVPSEKITWTRAKEKIAERMSISDFHSACEPCGWKKMGVCEAALMRVKKSHAVSSVTAFLFFMFT